MYSIMNRVDNSVQRRECGGLVVVSDSEHRDPEFDPYLGYHVLSLSKTHN